MSETLPTGQLSNVPWRRSGVKYTNNEAYFDVIEEVDAIIDKSGNVVSGEIHGYVSNEQKDIKAKIVALKTGSLKWYNRPPKS